MIYFSPVSEVMKRLSFHKGAQLGEKIALTTAFVCLANMRLLLRITPRIFTKSVLKFFKLPKFRGERAKKKIILMP